MRKQPKPLWQQGSLTVAQQLLLDAVSRTEKAQRIRSRTAEFIGFFITQEGRDYETSRGIRMSRR